MRRIIHLLIVVGMSAPLAGCFVHTGPDRGPVVVRERECPPAHHWDGGECVHNGRGHDRDNDDDQGHDHDHGHGHGHDRD
jgi:hypothetical protein